MTPSSRPVAGRSTGKRWGDVTKRKTPQPPGKPVPMKAQRFVAEFASRQTALLQAMALQIQNGEIALDDSPATDKFINQVIDLWCEGEEPTPEDNVEMIAVLFLDSLLEMSSTRAHTPANDTEPRSATAADVFVEAMKTIQTIWGKHGKT